MIHADKIGIDDARVEITLADGRKIIVDNTRICAKGLKIEDASSGSNKFEIGYTSEKVLTLILRNTDEYYTLVDFEEAIFKPYIINNSVATQKGVYKSNKVVRDKGLITITAYDDMCRLAIDIDKSAFTFPATHAQIMAQLATACGIQIDSTGFSNSALIVTEIPDKIKTYRELAGYIAQCAGSVFRESNSGIFGFYDYNKTIFPSKSLDGGDFLNYQTGDAADGGDFTDYSSGYVANGGTLGDRQNIHNLYGFKSLKVGQNDTIITGIRITVNKVNHDAGTEDYRLVISNNPLITEDNVQQVLQVLTVKYIGLRFRTINCSLKSDFRIEAMDPAYACDLKGNTYQFYVTNVTYTVRSATTVSCSAETKSSNGNSASKTTSRLLQIANSESKKYADQLNAEVQTQLDDVNNAVDGINTTIETDVADNIITTSEKDSIKALLKPLAKEKTDIDCEYKSLYYNVALPVGDTKTELKSAYDNYVVKYNLLVTAVTNIANSTSEELSTNVNVYNTAYDNYKSVSNVLSTAVSNTVLVIADNTAQLKLNTAISNIDASMEQLANQLASSSGLYFTSEPQQDGSKIYYMHDKSTLATSQIVYKFTAQAFGISTDGGKTYPYGLDASADMVMNTVATRGILFDWAKGGTLKLGGINNGDGQLTVSDYSGKQIGSISVDGLKAIKGLIGNFIMDSEGFFAPNFGINSVTANDNICLYAGGGRDTMNQANFQLRYDGSVLIRDILGKAETRINSSGFRSRSNWGDYLDLTGKIFNAMTIWKAADEARLNEAISNKLSSNSIEISKGLASGNFLDGLKLTSDSVYVGVDLGAYSTMTPLKIITTGSLDVFGSKHRVVDTENYGKVMMNAYETPTPMFGDIGEGQTDEHGYCYIALDDKFIETLDEMSDFIVFITKYGKGDLYVESRKKNYFVVRGTENLKFAWEVKATQKEYNTERLDNYQNETDLEAHLKGTENYADIGAQFLEDYEKELTENEKSI